MSLFLFYIPFYGFFNWLSIFVISPFILFRYCLASISVLFFLFSYDFFSISHFPLFLCPSFLNTFPACILSPFYLVFHILLSPSILVSNSPHRLIYFLSILHLQNLCLSFSSLFPFLYIIIFFFEPPPPIRPSPLHTHTSFDLFATHSPLAIFTLSLHRILFGCLRERVRLADDKWLWPLGASGVQPWRIIQLQNPVRNEKRPMASAL